MDYSAWVQTTNIFVVIGVSLDHAKYGYRVWKHLRLKGLTALPVNPKYDHIEGERAYTNLETVVRQNPGIVDKIVVITVVPPAVTQTVLKAAHSLGVKWVWMQPGSEDDGAIETAQAAGGMQVVYRACIVRDGLNEAFLA